MKLEQVKTLLNRMSTMFSRMPAYGDPVIIERADKLLSEAVKLRVPGTGTILRSVQKEVDAAHDGAMSNQTNRTRKPLSFIDLRRAIKSLNDMEDVSTTNVEVDKRDEKLKIDRDSASAFESFAKEANRVNIANKPFAVQRVPLVLIVERPPTPEVLKRLGIKAEITSGYLVLHNQLVIGVTKKFLQPREKADQAAMRVAENISDRRSVNLHMVIERGYPYQGAVWYWFAESQLLDRLGRGLGNLDIRDWGFAFSGSFK